MDRGDTLGTLLDRDKALLREHLLESLSERVRDFRRASRRCRKRNTEQAVHHLRVQLRRLLALFDLLACLLPETDLKQARKKVKKRLDDFDDLRDTHVQLIFTAGMLRDFPELKPVHKKLQKQEERLLQPAARRARHCALRWLHDTKRRIKRHIKALFATRSVRVRPSQRILQAVQTAFDRAGALRAQITSEDLTTIHRTRIAFKRFRYMIELLQPLLPSVSAQQLVAMDAYQTMMGNIQDIGAFLDRLDGMIDDGKLKRGQLEGFRQVVLHRRTALVQAYLEAADELSAFWPAPETAVPALRRAAAVA
jgi:CHAD domain-containing protein